MDHMRRISSPWLVLFIFSCLAAVPQCISSAPLLPSDTPKEACRSKVEQHELWKSSNYKMSDALQQSLDEYEHFHAKCRDQEGEDPIAFKKSFLAANGTPTYPSCQYLLWYNSGEGLGNVMLSLVSAFLFSVLTRRVFVIDNDWNPYLHFCEPFSNSSWGMRDDLHTEHMQAMVAGDWVQSQRIENTTIVPPPGPLYLRLIHVDTVTTDLFCDSNLAILSHAPVLCWKSNQYTIPTLYATHFKDEMEQLFPDRLVLTPLMRYLFNPTNDVWDEISTFHKSFLSSADARIGLQLRADEWVLHRTTHVHYCVDTLGVYTSQESPEVDEVNKIPITNSQNFSASQGSPPVEQGNGSAITKHVAIFVASLYSSFYTHLQEEYEGRGSVNGTLVTVCKATDEGSQKGDARHRNKAILDTWLLSSSETLVTSTGSTFGYIATALSGRAPFQIDLRQFWENNPLYGRPCELLDSSEACYQNPQFSIKCPNGDPNIIDPREKDIDNPYWEECFHSWGGAMLKPPATLT
eukprot:TRINITY_DN32625_c0_g1_i1.p1 TRINITY_DN32625_c0_g1~~TRINITY_DN32625_c0_g1_i1.p1  ORF type:complete len:520 (+),score=1.69 TRINITY_DN32625_c0_g1_i1:396-1955(+)